jgi:hypothetical protein
MEKEQTRLSSKIDEKARYQWLMPVILVTLGGRDQEDSCLKFSRPYLKNTQHKKGVMEWLK